MSRKKENQKTISEENEKTISDAVTKLLNSSSDTDVEKAKEYIYHMQGTELYKIRSPQKFFTWITAGIAIVIGAFVCAQKQEKNDNIHEEKIDKIE